MIVMIVFPAEVRMPMAVTHFVASEVLDAIVMMMLIPALAAMRIFSVPSVMTVETIVYMSPEVFTSAIPRTSTDENASAKPFGAIVAVGGALVRRIVEIAVGANWRRPDLYSDLRLRPLG
jgi:hypothetical protein